MRLVLVRAQAETISWALRQPATEACLWGRLLELLPALSWYQPSLDANKEIALPEEEVAKIHGTQFEVENRLIWVQCDQIGRFLNVLGKKFSYKSSQNIWWLFGLFWTISFLKQNLWWLLPIFGHLSKKLGSVYSHIWSHYFSLSLHFEKAKSRIKFQSFYHIVMPCKYRRGRTL